MFITSDTLRCLRDVSRNRRLSISAKVEAWNAIIANHLAQPDPDTFGENTSFNQNADGVSRYPAAMLPTSFGPHQFPWSMPPEHGSAQQWSYTGSTDQPSPPNPDLDSHNATYSAELLPEYLVTTIPSDYYGQPPYPVPAENDEQHGNDWSTPDVNPHVRD
jgi:hypothetical protein